MQASLLGKALGPRPQLLVSPASATRRSPSPASVPELTWSSAPDQGAAFSGGSHAADPGSAGPPSPGPPLRATLSNTRPLPSDGGGSEVWRDGAPGWSHGVHATSLRVNPWPH